MGIPKKSLLIAALMMAAPAVILAVCAPFYRLDHFNVYVSGTVQVHIRPQFARN